MKQQKKEPITRKMIEKEINYAAKAELGYIAYPIIVTVVLLVPLLLLAIFGFRDVPWLFIPYLAVISLCILLCGYSVYFGGILAVCYDHIDTKLSPDSEKSVRDIVNRLTANNISNRQYLH